MKYILLLLLFSPALVKGQTIYDSIPYNETGYVTFEKVFEVKGSKDTLFTKAKMWLSQIINNAKFAIRNEDREAGIIYFSTNIDFTHPEQWVDKVDRKTKVIKQNDISGFANLKTNIKIFLKDNKAKIVFENLSYKRFLSESYSDLTKPAIENIKNYPVKTLKDEADRNSMEFLYRGVLITINKVEQSFINYMNKKAENDF